MVTQATYDTLLQDFKRVKELSDQQQAIITHLQFELLQLKKLIYGSKSERFDKDQASAAMPTLFEVPPMAEEVVVSTQQVSYERKQKEARPHHPGRNPFPEHLRREVTILEPSGVDLSTCVRTGEDATEVLAYTPPELYVKRTVRPRYHIPAQQRMVQASAPERSFSRSSIDESLAAQILVEKYVDHLPLYRQAKRYERLGVALSESTLGDIMAVCAALLGPLYEAHRQEVLSSGYLHVDETTIKVQDSDKKGATHRGYYWVFYDNLNRSVLFAYDPGRGRAAPQQMLEGYRGYLQSDGYAVYEEIGEQEGITLVGCLAHARRKFHEAIPSDADRAHTALSMLQAIYAVERQIKTQELSGSDKRQYRQTHAQPLLDAFKAWMIETYATLLPKSAMGKAIEYSLKRWDKLSLYAQTDLLEPDNNKVENSIRPVAIGRKNYLFAGSHSAAQRGAVIYSLLGTCKAHGIEPYAWLHDVLRRLPSHPINRIKELLPQYYKQ
jgi:transposase